MTARAKAANSGVEVLTYGFVPTVPSGIGNIAAVQRMHQGNVAKLKTEPTQQNKRDSRKFPSMPSHS